MVYYESCRKYIESCTTLEDKIAAIDAIIDALILSAADIAGNGDQVNEYQLNDGQTIIREVYRGSERISSAITAFETIKQRYVSRLNGRVRRLVNSKSFRTYGSRF